jgi:predicted MFS family arabinose efflux permease
MSASSTRASSAWGLPFVVTLAAMFALQLSNIGFSPLLPSIQHQFGMSYKQLGLFTGVYGLLALALSVPAGLCAKRFGEKRVLAAGLLGVAAGSVLLGQAWNFQTALAFRGLTIFGYRFAFVSVLIAIALTAPSSLRGRTMGILGATSALASVVGAPIGGALADDLGWRLAVLGYAAMAILGVIAFLLFYRPAQVETSNAAGTHAGGVASNRSAFLSPVVWILALIVGMGGFGQFTVTNFVPSVGKALYNLDGKTAGLIISTGYITAIVEPCRRLSRRSLQQTACAWRYLHSVGNRIVVDDDRKSCGISSFHSCCNRSRFYRGESIVRTCRQHDVPQ